MFGLDIAPNMLIKPEHFNVISMTPSWGHAVSRRKLRSTVESPRAALGGRNAKTRPIQRSSQLASWTGRPARQQTTTSKSGDTHSPPCIRAELEFAHGLCFCGKRIAKLMRQRGLVQIFARRGVPRHLPSLCDELAQHGFGPPGRKQLWLPQWVPSRRFSSSCDLVGSLELIRR